MPPQRASHVSASEKNPVTCALDFGSDGDDDPAGGVELKINEEYARKFEHNKKREELQRRKSSSLRKVQRLTPEMIVDEKYKNKRKWLDSESEDGSLEESGGDESSSDEEEDEFGEFADEVADKDILATIQAIRSKDPRIYDGQTRFFKSASMDEGVGYGKEDKEKKGRPMYLKDYHRMNLLNGLIGNEDEADEKPKTYLEEQQSLKHDLVKVMQTAAEDIGSESESANNDFLSIKKAPTEEFVLPPPDPSTADPENPDDYLASFLASKAWLPKDHKNVYGPAMESDDSEEEEIAEQYEQGFNLRFEDPPKAAQLVGHARGIVKPMSARRDVMSARKRAREAKAQRREDERRQREVEKGRLRALKVEQLMEKVKQIQEVAGLGDGSEDPDSWKELLKGSFSERKWDELMSRKFGDDYYRVREDELPEKPIWEDGINLGDIEMEAGISLHDEDAAEDEPKGKGKTRRDYEREKRERKKREKETRKELEKFVDKNIHFDEEV